MNFMKKIIIAQTISVLLVLIGLLGMIREAREAMEWNEWIPENLAVAVMLSISACLFLIFLHKEKPSLFRLANAFAAVGMGMIFLPIADDCLFSGDVPRSSILLFGTPSALRVVAGVLAAWKGITPASKTMAILVVFINCFTVACAIGLLLRDIASVSFELGSVILYVDMAVFMDEAVRIRELAHKARP